MQILLEKRSILRNLLKICKIIPKQRYGYEQNKIILFENAILSKGVHFFQTGLAVPLFTASFEQGNTHFF